MSDLNKKNIGAGSHYPLPCHLQPGYKTCIRQGSDLKISELISSQILSLPLDESITQEQINYVCDELVKSIKSNE